MKNLSFPISIDQKTKGLALSDEASSIREAIEIIIFTEKGERIGNADFGTNLARFMFEPIDYVFMDELKLELSQSISEYEKRIENLNIELEEKSKNGTVNVKISYDIKNSSSDESNFLIDFSSGLA